jgi:hypothetical protein
MRLEGKYLEKKQIFKVIFGDFRICKGNHSFLAHICEILSTIDLISETLIDLEQSQRRGGLGIKPWSISSHAGMPHNFIPLQAGLRQDAKQRRANRLLRLRSLSTRLLRRSQQLSR